MKGTYAHSDTNLPIRPPNSDPALNWKYTEYAHYCQAQVNSIFSHLKFTTSANLLLPFPQPRIPSLTPSFFQPLEIKIQPNTTSLMATNGFVCSKYRPLILRNSDLSMKTWPALPTLTPNILVDTWKQTNKHISCFKLTRVSVYHHLQLHYSWLLPFEAFPVSLYYKFFTSEYLQCLFQYQNSYFKLTRNKLACGRYVICVLFLRWSGVSSLYIRSRYLFSKWC